MGERMRGAAAMGTVMLCLVLLLQQPEVGSAAIHTVGDDLGWTFNVSSWPIGKTFQAGDVLGITLVLHEFFESCMVLDDIRDLGVRRFTGIEFPREFCSSPYPVRGRFS